jgi:Integrase zinc binding domain
LIKKSGLSCIAPLLFQCDALRISLLSASSSARDSKRLDHDIESPTNTTNFGILSRVAFCRHTPALHKLVLFSSHWFQVVLHIYYFTLSFSKSLVSAQTMTDRSNYGPVRRLSPVSADNSRKPYSRTGLKGVLGTLDLNSGDVALPTAPDSPYYPFHIETPQLEAPTQNRPTAPDGPRDMAGFPTYEQYLRIEEEYLTSLSDRKQPKALISQALFDKIFAVLQNGSEDRASTAQFRFWVRKMFVLAYPQTSFFTSRHNAGGGGGGGGGGVSQSSSAPEPVVLHDKRPVAIKEQLYEVLCYCHAMARHGGRDKTCATLRLNYSWVPKELTAKFVKACPTCTLKRSGNPDLLSHFGQAVQSHPQPQLHYAPQILPSPSPLPAVEPPLLFPGGPNDSPPSLSFVVGVGSAGFDEANGGSGCSTGFGPSIFATPDLSVYPSPTLSTGSLGPMTPSPYLPSGLFGFGYPAVFDPGHGYGYGHGSLSSVSGWDPSPLSPCVPMMYAEEMRAGAPMLVQPVSVDEIIDMRARGMQLHLPTPKAVRAMRTRVQSCGGDGEGDGDDDGREVDNFSGVMDTPCPVDMSNIDPVLLVGGGYPSLTLVGPHTHTVTGQEVDAEADAEADMDPRAGSIGEPPCFHNRACTWETLTPVVGTGYPTSLQELTVTPGRPLPPPLDDVDCVEEGQDVDVDETHRKRMRMPYRLSVEDARWDRPEAWLVHSDSTDDARSI